jgi:phenylalanyl-tRNA synthetase beta chain
MLETGQPLHIFDYDALPKKQKTNQILIRRADGGEKFITLNQQKLILDSEDLVISVGGKAFELAGIVGNRETVVNSQTRNILIECASYDSEAIKETVTRLNIFSRTSQYFS